MQGLFVFYLGAEGYNLSVIFAHARCHLPYEGEALAFRDVFQQVPISFSENETSLPRAPLVGKTPPAGGGGTQVPKGERLSSECETEGFCPRGYQSNLSVIFAALDATSPTKGRLWCFRKVLMFFR